MDVELSCTHKYVMEASSSRLLAHKRLPLRKGPQRLANNWRGNNTARGEFQPIALLI